MSIVKLKKGYNLRLNGAILNDDITNVSCREFAIIPDDYHGISPRLDIKEGMNVSQGDILFHDRQNTEIVVTSPVSGMIKEVRRGERRKIEAIIIEKIQGGVSLPKKFNVAGNVKSILLESGLWAYLRQRPYDVVPSPNVVPRDIFITAFDSAPLAPNLIYLIKEKEQYLQRGIDVLASLTDGRVYVGVNSGMILNLKNAVVNEFEGPHPAGNVGVQISNVKPINKGETVWTLDIVTVARIGELFTTGSVSYNTIVAVTGPRVESPRYVEVEIGALMGNVLEGNIVDGENNVRIISGNVLTGNLSSLNDYLRYPYRHVTVIDENDNPAEFMGWASLSPKKFSVYRSFFSWLCPGRTVNLDAKLNGGERAIVMAGEYDKMLPMDIYAEFLIKAILAFDVDKMERLGIYEVAPEDFALCEFADTSKLELQKIVRDGLDHLRKEME